MSDNVKFFSLSDNALTIEFGSEISENLNRRAIKLSNYFEQNKFPGFIETVPAYASVTIFFDIFGVRRAFPEFTTAFDAVKKLAENALENSKKIPEKETRLIEIPVSFAAEFALDLEFVAKENHLKTREVIEIFTAKIYRVYMLGFLPGFSYMGEVDASIATPRRQAPRLKVSKGSIGIAGRQTGIYSLESPGGWQIIGKTDVELFTPEAENPCLLQPGDTVKFYERSNS